MKLLSIVVLVLLHLVSSQASTINKLSPHATAHFQRLMVTFPELFTSEEEKQERLQYFVASNNKIDEHNNGPDGRYFKLAHNRMSILSSEEKSSMRGKISQTTSSRDSNVSVKPGATVSAPKQPTTSTTTTTTKKPTTTTKKPTTTTKKPTTTTKKPTTTTRKPTPPPRLKAFDLRNTTCGKQIPVKDQGECGSCWAFSTIAPIEWALCNKTGTYTRLSEEQLVACDDEDYGCNGGDVISAMSWILDSQNKGAVATEESYPYVSGDDGGNSTNATNSTTCNMGNADVVIGATLTNWTMLPCGSDSGSTTINTAVTIAIENAILKYGVVAACILDNSATGLFDYYESGVFRDASCQSGVAKFQGCGPSANTNHCISLVGWGLDKATNLPYWILRNQWGTEWGMGGYMHIQKGVNMCGIESEVVYAKVA